MGFNPDIVVKTIQWLKQTSKLRSADIVELNPRFDVDQSTARLAARLIEVFTN
jgi:formiminoglutamase